MHEQTVQSADGTNGASERFAEYTEKVFAKLKWKKVRPLVKEELEAHLAESSGELFLSRNCSGDAESPLACGETSSPDANRASFDDESDQAAITAMGQPEETGERLNGLYRPRVDVVLLVGVGLLMALALWVVPLGEWALCVLGVFALGSALLYFDVRQLLQKYALYIFLAGVLALVFIPFFAPMINVARRWLPAEFAGVFLCICGMGAMLGDGRDVKHPRTILYILALTAIPCFILLGMPHFSMLVMFGLSMWTLYFRSKMPRAFVWGLLVMGLLFCLFLLFQAEYRLRRFDAILNPWALDPIGDGYLPYTISSAWQSAEWFGPATLHPEVARFLSAAEDYQLTCLATSAGKLPAYLVIALNALVVWRMLHLSLKLKDRLSSIVSFGASALMAIMSGIGILSSFGWLLSGGNAMFINASATYWLLQGACVSVVFALNLNRDYIRLSQGSKPDIESARRRLRIRLEWTK